MKKKFLVISLLLLFLIVGSLAQNILQPTNKEDVLNVHFIDVGQADSILINTASSAMLIDGGNNSDSNLVVDYLKSQGITKLDYVIGTHPHEDHIGGLDKVISTYDVGKVILPKVQSNTKTFEDLLQAIKNKGLKVTTGKAGIRFNLDSKTTCEIFSPNNDNYDEINDYSVVTKLVYGNNTFLFTGDAGIISEKEMIDKGYNLKSDVLKIGHHGSKYSTSKEFLEAISPKYSVISVGADNSYNHPDQETLKKLSNIKTFRTDINGTLVMTSDGNNISVEEK